MENSAVNNKTVKYNGKKEETAKDLKCKLQVLLTC